MKATQAKQITPEKKYALQHKKNKKKQNNSKHNKNRKTYFMAAKSLPGTTNRAKAKTKKTSRAPQQNKNKSNKKTPIHSGHTSSSSTSPSSSDARRLEQPRESLRRRHHFLRPAREGARHLEPPLHEGSLPLEQQRCQPHGGVRWAGEAVVSIEAAAGVAPSHQGSQLKNFARSGQFGGGHGWWVVGDR